MGKELVVKTNRLNECMQNLELVEMRVLAMAICKFRQAVEFNEYEEPSSSEVVRINASEYGELYGLSRYTAHEAILNAERSLFQRQFTIINDKGNRVKSRWISHVEYIDGENAINIALSPIVVDNVTRIQNTFTSYYIEQSAGLKSRYSYRLFELLKQWISVKDTPVFELPKLRYQLGLLPHENARTDNFKKVVLDKAVDEINTHTDLFVSYEQVKKGRTIIGFKFRVITKEKMKTVNNANAPVAPPVGAVGFSQGIDVYNRIVADDDLLKRFIEANFPNGEYLSGADQFYYQNGNFRGLMASIKYRFEQEHTFKRLNLSFLAKTA